MNATDLKALAKTVRATPADAIARLVYADALEEAGKPSLAYAQRQLAGWLQQSSSSICGNLLFVPYRSSSGKSFVRCILLSTGQHRHHYRFGDEAQANNWIAHMKEAETNRLAAIANRRVEQQAERQAIKTRRTEYPGSLSRDEAILRIRTALCQRSGKSWSVTGGTGTAYGCIHVDAPPARRTWHFGATHKEEYEDASKKYGHMAPTERAELAKLLGLAEPVHYQGVSIADSTGHRWEYVDRAEGREPRTYGSQYWD